MKTDQEILDIVVPAMIAQGAPSYDTATQACLYRGPSGRKCAAGVLIPDEDYDVTMEGARSDCLDIPEAGSEFLRRLQVAHDQHATDGFTGVDWLYRFLESAKRCALSHGLIWREEWVCP